jgi:transcription elongation factor GreB
VSLACIPVSKAFTDEETAEPPRIVPARPPLPPGVPNYVTARGLARLHTELALLRAERVELEAGGRSPEQAERLTALSRRRAELEQRIASAERIAPPDGPCDTVRLGASVSVSGASGVRRYRIVGVDEADAARGDIAFVSPLARALLGRSVGDRVRLRAPRGDEELEIVAVDYAG